MAVGPPRKATAVGPRGRVSPAGVLLVAWTGFIVYGTLLPFRFTTDLGAAAAKARALGGVPGRRVSRTDVASNVLLFVPWGLAFAGRRAGPGRRFGATVLGAAAGGLALSGAVEGLQLFTPDRVPSLLDLAANTAGAALGAAAGWPLARRYWPAWSPALGRHAAGRPLAACALAAAAGLLADGLAPFDVSLDPGDLKAALRKARPVPFGPPGGGPAAEANPWGWAGAGAAWALAGGLSALALREAGSAGPRAAAAAGAACGGLALLIEAAQLALPSRTADMTAALVALGGSTAGAAAVVGRPGWRARRWVGPALAVWAAAAVLAAWTPPRLAPPDRWRPHWSQAVPFWEYYRDTGPAALADLIHQVLAFVPLGALLAVRSRRASVRGAAAVGLCLGLILEAGQLPLAGRTADVTDALSAAAGAAAGMGLCRRGGPGRGP